jgi:D-alanyl-D-alanine carboxypeptidase
MAVTSRGAALVALVAALSLGSAVPAYAGTKQADARLDRVIRELVAVSGGPPGAAVLVQRGRQVKLHSFGVADQSNPGAGPIGARDHMRIASTSKAFNGAVALALVRKGRLRLNSTIGEVLPELPAAWSGVTLRQLLQHTGGVPSYTEDPDFLAYLSTHLRDYIPPEQAISFVADQPLEFSPGTSFHYSNTDNLVIGLMAQRATGRSYEALVRSLVSKPLGLGQTSLPSGFMLPHPFVHGYAYDGPGMPLEEVSETLGVSWVWAAGAIVSTMRDMNRFIRAWGAGSFLTPKLRRAQTRFIAGAAGDPPGPGANSGGLTLYRYKLPCGTLVGHTGNFPGYTQFMASSRDGRRSTVVSVNLQLDVGVGTPGVFPILHRLFQRAGCAALAG